MRPFIPDVETARYTVFTVASRKLCNDSPASSGNQKPCFVRGDSATDHIKIDSCLFFNR